MKEAVRLVLNGSRYVGNTMATFCMQTLGCEVSAINTVNYSEQQVPLDNANYG